METSLTAFLSDQQDFCWRSHDDSFVACAPMEKPQQAARRIRAAREALDWSTSELAARARAYATEAGLDIKLTQQSVSNFEQGDAKRLPVWLSFVDRALLAGRNVPDESRQSDDTVMVAMLPTYAGAGGGGTGEGDKNLRAFSGTIMRELRVRPEEVLLIEIEGDSLAPEYLSGDMMLVHTGKKSIAQPGAFCLWDGDGYVVKYLEKIPGSDPPSVRIISGNPRYSPMERTIDEVQIMGRIAWFARRV